MPDLLIRGARVFDGLGNAPVNADVAVSDGVIQAIGEVSEPATQTVDADGLALMPGIVDLHTHYDAQVTWDNTMSPSPSLGVTTAVIGNCGFGIAPCPTDMRETMVKNLSVVEGMDRVVLSVHGSVAPHWTVSEHCGVRRALCHSHRGHGRGCIDPRATDRCRNAINA